MSAIGQKRTFQRTGHKLAIEIDSHQFGRLSSLSEVPRLPELADQPPAATFRRVTLRFLARGPAAHFRAILPVAPYCTGTGLGA